MTHASLGVAYDQFKASGLISSLGYGAFIGKCLEVFSFQQIQLSVCQKKNFYLKLTFIVTENLPKLLQSNTRR